MNKIKIFTLALLFVLASGGCAYRHYLGMHGPSTRAYPEVHSKDISKDGQCLECHASDSASDAPQTSHPGFKGCLQCHND